MTDWEDSYDYRDEDSSSYERPLIWRVVIRSVAGILLFSMLGGLYIVLRGIAGMSTFVGVIAVSVLIAIAIRVRRAAEDPYRSDDSPGIDPH